MKNITEINKAMLKSLSERLKFLATINNAYSEQIDQKIRSENLQFNLSWIIAHIISNLKFPNQSIEVFNQIIFNYNKQHDTNLTFTDFEEINWIRIIDGEVLIPEVIRHYIWEVEYEGKKNISVKIPAGKEDITHCLQRYYQICNTNENIFISKDILNVVLKEQGFKEVTENFLCDRKIIEYDTENKIYYWTEEQKYTRYLKNEIASTLWLVICGENASEEDFRTFFRITRKTNLYFDNLNSYLNEANRIQLSKLALSFLQSERDLLNSDNEFRKMWLDAYAYSQININTEIPKIIFDYSNTFNFIQSVFQYEYRFSGVYDGGDTRRVVYPLLRIIAANAPFYPVPYQTILNILKDTDRPFLILEAYHLIRNQYPQIIPYLLTENDLIPVAFDLLYKVTFDNKLLSGEIDKDKNEEKKCEAKNKIWLEMFDFVLDSFTSYSSKDTEVIAKILLNLSQKVFNYQSFGSSTQIINHNSFRKLYDAALKKLSEHRKQNTNYYSTQTLSIRTIFTTIPHIIDYLTSKLKENFPTYNDLLKIKSGLVDLSIEIIRNSSIRYVDNELTREKQSSLISLTSELIKSLNAYLLWYYSQENISVLSYDSTETQKLMMAKRGINEFGFEIIDWGYLYLHFEKTNLLDHFYNDFIKSLIFDTDSDEYDSRNKEQAEKIKLYLKSLMIGFLSINQKKDSYEIEGFPVKQTLEKIAQWIKIISLQYSVNDTKNRRIDIFEGMYNFSNNIYSQSLISLLYESINYFTNQEDDPFINLFFNQNADLGKMLRAINIIESDKYRNIISQQISSLKIEDFINQSILTTSIQNALIDAVNSEEHWQLALPLIHSIDNHYKRIKHSYEGIDNLIFEANLLYAFKEKDYNKLLAIQLPERKYKQYQSEKTEYLRQFYIALFQIYNNKDYPNGIKILKKLLSKNPKAIQYAYHIYRAETLQVLLPQSDINALIDSNQSWENFINNLNEKEKNDLIKYEQGITSNKLHYFAATNDMDKFDQALNSLSIRFLYHEEIIPTIYNFYLSRSLYVLAHNYIKSAFEYLQLHHKPIQPEIQSLFDNSETKYLLREMKDALSRIPALKPKNIPLITPEVINDKGNLSEFILHEFVDASKVMIEKIHGIKEVSGEDRYNDLFVATLKLRFQLWGWSIHDQARRGNSPTKKSAGETDLTIEAGNKTIALFEALILRGKNKKTTQTHIIKTFGYAKNLERYYMIIYFTGKSDSFHNTWNSYKADTETCIYPANYTFDTTKGFKDLSPLFDDINHLKIAKSMHGHNIEMYHMMIDLSE